MSVPTNNPISSLPLISADLPGVGGQLRLTPDHFIVEELPLYEPQGDGPHLYLNITKVGLTTKEVQIGLERLLGLGRGEVGFAGLKDKAARTTQTFSVPVNAQRSDGDEALVQRVRDTLPLTVNWARRHRNKLKAGHLLGNHFTIIISDLALPPDAALAAGEAIAQRILRSGAPNYFGRQRFGGHGDNAEQGLEILLGRRHVRDHWLRRFLISAFQSELCNRYLARRVEMGAFAHLLDGDVAKKHATGGMFDVDDAAAEQPRYDNQEISFTAPLYGFKMWPAQRSAAELETSVLAETGLTDDQWRTAKIEGTRRLGRLLTPDLRLATDAAGLRVTFSLPKGGFATTLLREIMKNETDDLPEEQVDFE